MKGDNELLSTAEAGERLGVTRQRILELITAGRLPARKVGRSYVVRAGDVSSLERNKVGRPPAKKVGKGRGKSS
jgi:excisionase family DNA binding protein